MAGHRREPGIDLPRLARPDAVDRGLHVVEDPAPRHPAQNTERLGQSVKQHLVGLQQIAPNDERPAVRQLGVGHLQLTRSPPRTAQSSLQSNWNASPGAKTKGTNVPRPLV